MDEVTDNLYNVTILIPADVYNDADNRYSYTKLDQVSTYFYILSYIIDERLIRPLFYEQDYALQYENITEYLQSGVLDFHLALTRLKVTDKYSFTSPLYSTNFIILSCENTNKTDSLRLTFKGFSSVLWIFIGVALIVLLSIHYFIHVTFSKKHYNTFFDKLSLLLSKFYNIFCYGMGQTFLVLTRAYSGNLRMVLLGDVANAINTIEDILEEPELVPIVRDGGPATNFIMEQAAYNHRYKELWRRIIEGHGLQSPMVFSTSMATLFDKRSVYITSFMTLWSNLLYGQTSKFLESTFRLYIGKEELVREFMACRVGKNISKVALESINLRMTRFHETKQFDSYFINSRKSMEQLFYDPVVSGSRGRKINIMSVRLVFAVLGIGAIVSVSTLILEFIWAAYSGNRRKNARRKLIRIKRSSKELSQILHRKMLKD